MRKRIAQRIVSGQDICLFCAFRPSFEPHAWAAQRYSIVRNLSYSVRLSAPTGAAARQQDEDEVDPPMLRQNANLANSFPTRRQSPQSSRSHPDQPRTSDPTKNNPNFTRSRHDRIPHSGNSLVRKPGDDGSIRQGSAGQPRNAQENRSDRGPPPRTSVNENRHQRSEEYTGRFELRDQPQQRRAADRFPSFERQNKATRRFSPSNDLDQSIQGNITSSKPAATSRRGEQGQQRQRQDRSTSEQPLTFRRVVLDNLASTSPSKDGSDLQPPSRNQKTYERPNSARAENNEPREVSTDDLKLGTENVEAPIGTSFDTSDDFGRFYHHRGHKEDRRKLRSARFEDEEDISEGQVSSTPQAIPGQRPRPASRGRDFDYAMAEAEEALYGDGNRRKKKGKARQVQQATPSRPSIRITEFMSVGQLANALGVQSELFIQRLEEEGFEGARYDHVLPAQDSSMIADLYGFDPVVATEKVGADLVARPPPEDPLVLPPRPPIVTIMGHVDHGKTTILDYLRKSSVVATEHGGITQHIGAFSVTMPGTNRQITFLDTPGHAAFLEMRRRGANVTDIVVLVVAADDSVKPQTIEAIRHAMQANVQVIVAINKIDKEDANIDRVKQDLTRHEIVVEDYGGEFQAVPVSGKTGQGMAELEEAIITLADVHDYRAELDGPAEGTIIESKVTAAGRVATVLVRRGTLRNGDFIVAGNTWARVRTLRDDTGALVKEAPPGTPVQVDGWRGEDPTAGLEVLQAEDEEQAKDVVDFRLEQRENLRAAVDMAAINEARTEEAQARAKVLEWEAQQEWAKKTFGRRPKDNAGWVEQEAEGGPKQVHFVVKADVAGSVEAVVAAVSAVGNSDVVANVVHSGTGQITESDIRMLATSGETGYAISFNQPVDGTMYRLAEAAGLQILDYNIIYKVTDVVKEKLADHLPPIVTQKVLGEAEVGQIFEVTVKKNKVKIAGCKVNNGTISRSNRVRVSRDGSVIYTGTLHSLKNVKKDVTEMRKGTECGMGFDDWEDFQPGDQIQCFEEHEEKRTLY